MKPNTGSSRPHWSMWPHGSGRKGNQTVARADSEAFARWLHRRYAFVERNRRRWHIVLPCDILFWWTMRITWRRYKIDRYSHTQYTMKAHKLYNIKAKKVRKRFKCFLFCAERVLTWKKYVWKVSLSFGIAWPKIDVVYSSLTYLLTVFHELHHVGHSNVSIYGERLCCDYSAMLLLNCQWAEPVVCRTLSRSVAKLISAQPR